MRIPVVRGLIDRRILVNYRVDPGVLSRILPRPFRPKLVNGTGVAGVCLIRLKHVRPRPAARLPGPLLGERRPPHRRGVGPGRRTTRGRLHPPAGHVVPAQHAGRRPALPGRAPPRPVRGRGARRPLPGGPGQRRPPHAPAGRGAGLHGPAGRLRLRLAARRRPTSSGGGRWGTRRRGAPAPSTAWNCGASPGKSNPWPSGGWNPASSTTGPCSPKARRRSTVPC